MSWWSDGAPPASARVLRGPRVSTTRPASLLVDPAKIRLHRAPRNPVVDPEVDEFDSDEAPASLVVDPVQQAADLAALAEKIETARRQGFEEGRTAGVAEARSRAQVELEERSRTAEEKRDADIASAAAALLLAVQRVEEAREEAVVTAETDCAELAFKLTRALLGRETQLSERPTVDSIVRALAMAPTNEAVVIRLNPDDITTLAGFDMSTLGRECTIIPDELVEHSGCIIEVGPTRIDAQLGRALGRVRKALLGMGHGHDDPHASADEARNRNGVNGHNGANGGSAPNGVLAAASPSAQNAGAPGPNPAAPTLVVTSEAVS